MSFYAGNRTYVMQLRRTIRSPLQRLYKAFEDHEDRSRWFSPNSYVDPREGGQFYSDNGAIGQFIEVLPLERWRLEWQNPNHKPGSRVVIEFAKNGRFETTIFIRHWRIKSKKDYEEIHRGWLWTLDSLEAFLEYGEPMAYQAWLEQHMAQS